MPPTFPPFSHFALTVTDFERSVAWYEHLFEVTPILIEETTYRAAIWFEPVFAIHAHQHHDENDAFDEHRVGLDHVAFNCSTRTELEEWSRKLDEMGIEHGYIVDAWYGSGLAFRDPDNIQLEFFVLAT